MCCRWVGGPFPSTHPHPLARLPGLSALPAPVWSAGGRCCCFARASQRFGWGGWAGPPGDVRRGRQAGSVGRGPTLLRSPLRAGGTASGAARQHTGVAAGAGPLPGPGVPAQGGHTLAFGSAPARPGSRHPGPDVERRRPVLSPSPSWVGAGGWDLPAVPGAAMAQAHSGRTRRPRPPLRGGGNSPRCRPAITRPRPGQPPARPPPRPGPAQASPRPGPHPGQLSARPPPRPAPAQASPRPGPPPRQPPPGRPRRHSAKAPEPAQAQEPAKATASFSGESPTPGRSGR